MHTLSYTHMYVYVYEFEIFRPGISELFKEYDLQDLEYTTNGLNWYFNQIYLYPYGTILLSYISRHLFASCSEIWSCDECVTLMLWITNTSEV